MGSYKTYKRNQLKKRNKGELDSLRQRLKGNPGQFEPPKQPRPTNPLIAGYPEPLTQPTPRKTKGYILAAVDGATKELQEEIGKLKKQLRHKDRIIEALSKEVVDIRRERKGKAI